MSGGVGNLEVILLIPTGTHYLHNTCPISYIRFFNAKIDLKKCSFPVRHPHVGSPEILSLGTKMCCEADSAYTKPGQAGGFGPLCSAHETQVYLAGRLIQLSSFSGADVKRNAFELHFGYNGIMEANIGFQRLRVNHDSSRTKPSSEVS